MNRNRADNFRQKATQRHSEITNRKKKLRKIVAVVRNHNVC